MENAEMPVNANAIYGHHGRDMLKKGLSVDRSEIDSGFDENWSISHSHATTTTAASVSGLSNSGKFASLSFKRSLDLETISECPDLKDLQETPTTRNIRTLNKFHINTPQNARNQLETTPTKANYFSLYDSGRSSHKKNSVRWSLNRSSPRLKSPGSSGRKSMSRSTLFESIDENFENIFTNDGEANACNQSINVSPIKPHNNSGMMVQPPENVHGLQRHASGIESSTPKTNFRRTRTQSIVKAKINLADEMIRNRLIRKAQSFSPAKRLALRETNFQHSIDPDDVLVKDDEPPAYNPAKKVLEFNIAKFDQLIQMQSVPEPSSLLQTPKKRIEANAVAKCDEPSSKQLPIKRFDKSRSRLVKEFSRKRSMKPTGVTVAATASMADKAKISLDASDILMSMATEQETDSEKCDNSLMETSDSAISTIKTTDAVIPSAATPMRSNYVEQDVRAGANRTPIKRFEKSTSYNFLSVKSSPEKEKFDIVYGHLPCTPPKNHPRRQLKRPLSSMHTDSPCPKAPSAKRKLYNDCKRQMYCNGIEKMDILSQLNNGSLDHIIEKILGYLPDEGLQAVHSVCKTWRALVDRNRRFSLRRRKFVKKMQTTKENVYKHEIKPIINNNNNNNNMKALHVHNRNCKVEEKTVTVAVSPSTRRFNEHQSIIRSLNPEQRVLHCPRCNGTSVVYPATGNELKAQRRSPRTKNRIGLMKPVVVSEYAVCSKKTCGFEFCTNCIGNRHLNTKCSKRPLGSSPKSDDDTTLYRSEQRRTTKRHGRRLGRLVF